MNDLNVPTQQPYFCEENNVVMWQPSSEGEPVVLSQCCFLDKGKLVPGLVGSDFTFTDYVLSVMLKALDLKYGEDGLISGWHLINKDGGQIGAIVLDGKLVNVLSEEVIDPKDIVAFGKSIKVDSDSIITKWIKEPVSINTFFEPVHDDFRDCMLENLPSAVDCYRELYASDILDADRKLVPVLEYSRRPLALTSPATVPLIINDKVKSTISMSDFIWTKEQRASIFGGSRDMFVCHASLEFDNHDLVAAQTEDHAMSRLSFGILMENSVHGGRVGFLIAMLDEVTFDEE